MASQRFFYAAKDNNIEELKRLIEEHPEYINSVDEHGYTALMMAVARDHKKVVEWLLENGANIDIQQQQFGRTALTIAVEENNTEIAQLLIGKNANLNIKTKDGHTALMLAALYNRENIVEALIASGANIKEKNSESKTAFELAKNMHPQSNVAKLLFIADVLFEGDLDRVYKGFTALMLAAKLGKIQSVGQLIEQGADKTLKNQGQLAYYIAEKNGHANIMQLLLENHYVDLRQKLFDLAGDNEIEELKRFIEKHPEYIDSVDEDGYTALMMAVARYDIEVVECLLENGANIDIQQQHSGRTALIIAMEHNYTDIAQLLISKHADVNKQDDRGRTALMLAAAMNKLTIVRTLIEAGADVNKQDNQGNTALMDAASSNADEVLKLLIIKYADINIENKHGETALIQAAMYRLDRSIVETLIAKGADITRVNRKLKTAFEVANDMWPKSDVAKLLFIENVLQLPYVDVNERNKYGFTALMLAAQLGKRESVQRLLDEKNADVNLINEGKRASTFAYEAGHQDIGLFLLNREPNPLSPQPRAQGEVPNISPGLQLRF